MKTIAAGLHLRQSAFQGMGMAAKMEEMLRQNGALAAAASILVWVLTRWFEMLAAWRRKRHDRAALIRSLFAEIDFNTRDLQFFIENSADLSAVEARLSQSPDYLPHLTDAHHTRVYSARIDDLHMLEDGLTARIVLFYGLLDKIKVQIDGINLKSYASVSVAGKMTVLRRIIANVRETEQQGQLILVLFSEKYRKYALTRHDRRLTDTRQR